MSSPILAPWGNTTRVIVAVAAIAIILFTANNIPIANAQQEEEEVTSNGITTTFESLVDGFRIQIPSGWVVEDIDNTDSTLQREEAELGYTDLAIICPQDSALPLIGGTYDCREPNVHITRFNFRYWPEFAPEYNGN